MTLYVEVNEQQCYTSLFNNQPVSFPPWGLGTIVPIAVIPVTRIVNNSLGNGQIFQPFANGSSWNIIAALGNGFLGPIAGQWFIQSGVNVTSGTITSGKWYYIETFVAGDNFSNVGAGANATGTYFQASGTTPTVWTHGSALQESTAELAYNALAGAIQTALNATAFVTTAGGCTCILENANFVVSFTVPGAVTTMIGNGVGLAPLTLATITPVLTGNSSAGIPSVQTIQLIQNPGAYQLLGNGSAAASITATRTQVGGGGYNETWQLVVDSRSFAGIFNILFENAASAVQETTSIAYNDNGTGMQTALQALGNIGANNCTVTQVAPWTYVIQFVGALANQAINANAIQGVPGGLQVPLGRYDNFNLQSSALNLIQNGQESSAIQFQILATPPAGVQSSIFLGSNTLITGIVPPYSQTPAPSALINPSNINWSLLGPTDPGAGQAWLNGTAVNVGP